MKSDYMNPYLAGILLGLILLLTIVVTGHGLGASGALKNVAAAVAVNVSPGTAASNEFFHGDSPMKAWLVFEIAGVILGAFLSGVISHRLTFETERPRTVRTGVRIAMAVAGGVLFGFGAQLARGCTSGAALSGMAVLSLGGILTMIAIFGAAYAVAFFFRKLWI